MTDRTFTVAGSTVHQGERKIRFANDLPTRRRMLKHYGHTEIDLFELPKPMTKSEIIVMLKGMGYGEAPQEAKVLVDREQEIQAAIQTELVKYFPQEYPPEEVLDDGFHRQADEQTKPQVESSPKRPRGRPRKEPAQPSMQ